MTLAEIQALLRTAHHALAQIRDAHSDAVSADTAFALGEALGMVRHAEALLSRDVAAQSLTHGTRHG